MRIEVPYQHYVIRIFIYLNHTNIAWGSTNRTNLKRLLTHQKYAIQVINNKVRFDHNAELFKSHEMLNIFELKVFNIAILMHKVNSNTAPATFHEFFKRTTHKYPAAF